MKKIIFILLPVFMALFLSGCHKNPPVPLCNNMDFKIEKGNHYSDFSCDRLHPNVVLPMAVNVELSAGCWYDRGDVEYTGMNKLIGVSGARIHRNSARLVWQPDFKKAGVFKLYGYVYENGTKTQEYIASVNQYEWFNFVVDYDGDKWSFTVNDTTVYMNGNKPEILFKTYPYFGGKSTAPNCMHIIVKR